jgi:hypothetical protein
LEHEDFAAQPAIVTEDLRDPGGFAGAGRGLDHDTDTPWSSEAFGEALAELVDGEIRSGHTPPKPPTAIDASSSVDERFRVNLR